MGFLMNHEAYMPVYDSFSDVPESRVWFASKNLTPLGCTETGMDAPPCGEGGVPRPAPSRKNDQNPGEVAGQNKGPNLNFLQ